MRRYDGGRADIMGLRFQFNLVLTIVFLLGLGISGFISSNLLRDNARNEVVRSAELMIEVGNVDGERVTALGVQIEQHLKQGHRVRSARDSDDQPLVLG